ncbi:MAG TPA: arginine--tRNA ligase, partial [Candidatus Thermoplasmatota archaeon]|nr:arginine--tRNA ligase [Candidatus Thermoplasmatota archaeon]
MRDPMAGFRAEVDRLLAAAAHALRVEAPWPALESPPDPAMGDLGLPCFPLARALRKSPAAIALDVASAVPQE